MADGAKIDRFDRRILLELQSNARQTNKHLAEAVGLAQSTTLERVRDLERRGIVTGHHTHVSLPALGRPLQAMVTLRIHPKTDAAIALLLTRLENLPETLAIYLLSGVDDVLVHLAVVDPDHLRQVVLSEISAIDGVVDEHTSIVFDYRQRRVVDLLEP